jgi:hypothetical protein
MTSTASSCLSISLTYISFLLRITRQLLNRKEPTGIEGAYAIVGIALAIIPISLLISFFSLTTARVGPPPDHSQPPLPTINVSL